MRIREMVLLVAFASLVSVAEAQVAGTFVPAPSRSDVIYDAGTDTVYVTNDRSILRYQVTAGTFAPAWTFDVPDAVVTRPLRVIDLSPDATTLAVADGSRSDTENWIWLVDIASGNATRVRFPLSFGEGGTFAVAWGADSTVFVTSTYEGSGWVWLRNYDPATATTTIVPSPWFTGEITQDSMLTASGDAAYIGFEESNISDGRFGRIRVADRSMIIKNGYTDGTGWFNYEIGVNADGTQYAIPTYGGTFITDANLIKTNIVGTYAGLQPIGVVYDPVRPVVYFAWSTTTEVRAHDTTTFAQTGSWNVGYVFGNTGNWALRQGRLEISRDGSLLMVTVGDPYSSSTLDRGVRVIRIYEPLRAGALTVSADSGVPAPITLAGSIGIPATLAYTITTPPSHGQLSGEAPNLTYVSDAGYIGTDSFAYQVKYGRAVASAAVSIRVGMANRPPVAYDSTNTTAEDSPVTVMLQAGDADSDPLTFEIVAAPVHGTLSGVAPTLTYTPFADFNGTDQFTFTASDADSTSNVATVTITVTAVNDPPVAYESAITAAEDSAAGVTLRASDRDGDALAFSIVAQPAHGTLSGTAPDLTYTPAADFNGTDRFTFSASDGQSSSNPAAVTVTVTPVNDIPVAYDSVATTSEESSVSVTLLASDRDGDPLTFSVVATPIHGTLSGTPPNLTYAPAADFNGTDQFTFTAADGQSASNVATVTVTVTPVNDIPVAYDSAVTTAEDSPVSATLQASDRDGDALTFSVVAMPAHGALSGVAPNLTYTPGADFNGTDQFTFMATDGNSPSNIATVTVTVTPVNDAPVAVPDASTTQRNTDVTIDVLANDYDIDTDPLVIVSVATPAHGSAVVSQGRITYSPHPSFIGTEQFAYTISDGRGGVASATVSVTVVKH